MYLITRFSVKPAFILSLAVILLSCSSVGLGKKEYIAPLQLNQKDNTAKSALIMPFINETDQTGIEELTRTSFYNHFSSKNYRDFELTEIARGLATLEKNSSSSWEDLPPADIGKFFHADYVIYGRVKEFKKIFLGIYSQIVLTVHMEVRDGSTGYLVWMKTVSKRSHEGGLPFSLFGIIPAALRSGFHMQEEKTIELVDKVSRELVDQIPEPSTPDPSPYQVEIQVASFMERRLAQEAQKGLEGKGLDARIEMVTLNNQVWHRVLLGPYYNLPEAEKARGKIMENTGFQPIFIHNRTAVQAADPDVKE